MSGSPGSSTTWPNGTAAPSGRGELQQVEAESGARRERLRRRRRQRQHEQAREHAGHRDRRERNGREIDQDAHRSHGPERDRRDRRSGERGADRRAEHAPDACGPRARSLQRVKVVAPQSAATESQPPRSRLAQGSTSRTQRQVAARSGSARTCRCRIRHQAATHGERGGTAGGRRPPQEGHIRHADDRRERQRASSRRIRGQPAEEKDPGRDQPDVEAGDRQQVHQAGPGEPVLQVGIDAAPPAEDERVHHAGARAVEAVARRVEEGRGVDRRAPGCPSSLPTSRTTSDPAGSAAEARPRQPRARDARFEPGGHGPPRGHRASTAPPHPARSGRTAILARRSVRRLEHAHSEGQPTLAATGRRSGTARPVATIRPSPGPPARRPRRPGARPAPPPPQRRVPPRSAPEPQNAEGRSRDRPHRRA